MLTVPYVLGRPLGVPNDHKLQHRVLSEALSLLTETDTPLLREFEDSDAKQEAAEDTWSCPVSFAPPQEDVSLADQVKAELNLLKPWHAEHLSSRGATTIQHTGPIEEIVDLLAEYLEPGVAADTAKLKQAAEDLKAFYNEAATSQPGTASAKELENWYWQETRAGDLVRAIKSAHETSEDGRLKLTAGFLLVPGAQSGGDH